MKACSHTTLELLPQRKTTFRCRHCHMTLSGDDLGEGFCPECFEASGSKRYAFEEIEIPERGIARYKCEECGAIISSGS
jgi:hypothetical protein